MNINFGTKCQIWMFECLMELESQLEKKKRKKMKDWVIFCCIILLILGELNCLSTYSAYIVEFTPITPNAGKNYTKQEAYSLQFKNFDQISSILDQIASSETNPDRIVFFPEYSTGYGPNFKLRDQVLPFLEELPNEINTNPCNDPSWSKSPLLQAFSCLAAKKSTHLVYTQGEIEPCDPNLTKNCPIDKRFQFNTQIAFDEKGFFLSKYRKSHLVCRKFFHFFFFDQHAFTIL